LQAGFVVFVVMPGAFHPDRGRGKHSEGLAVPSESDNLLSDRGSLRPVAQVTRDHADAKVLHVFPAIPAPVAVVCGFDLLPKAHPALLVYDNDKRNGGFVQRLEVNGHDRQ